MSDLAFYLVPVAISLIAAWAIQAFSNDKDTRELGQAIGFFGLIPGANIIFSVLIVMLVLIGVAWLVISLPAILRGK